MNKGFSIINTPSLLRFTNQCYMTITCYKSFWNSIHSWSKIYPKYKDSYIYVCGKDNGKIYKKGIGKFSKGCIPKGRDKIKKGSNPFAHYDLLLCHSQIICLWIRIGFWFVTSRNAEMSLTLWASCIFCHCCALGSCIFYHCCILGLAIQGFPYWGGWGNPQ